MKIVDEGIFDSVVLTIASAGAVGFDIRESAHAISKRFSQFKDDDRLEDELVETANHIIRFLKEQFDGPDNDLKCASACVKLSKAVKKYTPEGKMRRSIFRWPLFTERRDSIERKVESSLDRIKLYHFSVLSGCIDPRSLYIAYDC